MTLTHAELAFALKEYYVEDVALNAANKINAFTAMVPKDTKAGGENIPYPLVYANGQGRSADISTAITNVGNMQGKQFVLTYSKDYAIAQIDRLALKASMSKDHAFIKAQDEVDGAFETCARSLAKALYGSGSGSLGRLNTTDPSGGTTATLLNINDVENFEVGMVIKADTVDGGGTVHSGSVTLSAINRDTGVLTASANWDTGISAIGASDYLFQDGDYDAMLTGLAGWVPGTAPGATAFFGVDRTADVVRLGGNRLDATSTGLPIEEVAYTLAAKVSRQAAKVHRPDVIMMNDAQYVAMMKRLNGKVEYVNLKVAADVFFPGVRLHGPKGVLEVYPDFNCPNGKIYVLSMKSWKLLSVGPAPDIFDKDNDQEMLRLATADAYQVRIGYYGQLGCNAPGSNGVALVDAVTFS